MATQGKIAIRCVRTLSGNPIPKVKGIETAAQAYKKGALCFFDTNGTIAECGADPLLIAGVATADATGVTGTEAILEAAHPDNLFRGYVDTSAGEGTGVGVQTHVGKAIGVAKSASGGIWYLDLADFVNSRTVLWEFWGEPGFALTDVRAHCIFSFKVSVSQMFVGT